MIWRRTSPLAGQLQHIAGIVRQAAAERPGPAARPALPSASGGAPFVVPGSPGL